MTTIEPKINVTITVENFMKNVIKKIIHSLGLEVRRIGETPRNTSSDFMVSAYHAAVLALLSSREKLHIVVVGANDGKYNDPIFDLIKTRLAERTSLTLFEPQSKLIPFLEQNYAFHPDLIAQNIAIGPSDALVLHAISEKYWEKMQPAYATGWPVYRAPTGVTSSDRAAVAAWAAGFLEDSAEFDQVIERIEVSSSHLIPALLSVRRPARVDILQIDAEGFDDQVIYSCDIKNTQPSVIYFESKSLKESRKADLTKFFVETGYVAFEGREDTLCIRHKMLG